jgi:hypothetical protein
MTLASRMLVAAALVTAMAGTAAAQTSSGVLNTLDVQRLVAADTPAAHVALGKHFMALADQYAADASRYKALATAPSGNPNHPTPAFADTRRTRQADAATALSEAARDMATYHQLLSTGAARVAPADRARFDGGFGARVPTASEVAAVLAAARTAGDHRTLAEYFSTLAERSTADAKEHATMANNFRVSGQRRGSEFAAMHCDRLAKEARETAKEASASAALHRQLANVG